MEFLLISLWVAWVFTRNTTQDLVFKSTGKMPPSFLREQEKRAARLERAERRRAKSPGPGRKFFAHEWAEAVAEVTEKRDRKRAKKRAARRAEWDAEDLAAAEDEAYERNTREPADPDPVPAPEPARADREPYDWAEDPDLADPEPAPEPEPGVDGQPQPDWDGPWPEWKPAPGPEPANEQPGGDAPNVIDFQAWQRPEPTTTEGDTAVAEVLSLNAALTHTQESAAKARSAAASAETTLATLQAGGVTGPTIAHWAQVQEKFILIAADLDAAYAALARHIGVQEQYAANPDAGTREFVKAD